MQTDTENVITPTDVNWEKHVMSQFTRSEVFEKDGKQYPRVHGLRRVVELLIGPIVDSKVMVVCPPDADKPAVCEYEVCVLDQHIDRIRTYSSAADAHYNNTDNVFRMYLTTIAETRAEARALRKMLKLSVCSSEELSEIALMDAESISPPQVKAILNAAKKLNMSLNELSVKYHFSVESGRPVMSKDEAKSLISLLNKE